jgi:hypothetical protein
MFFFFFLVCPGLIYLSLQKDGWCPGACWVMLCTFWLCKDHLTSKDPCTTNCPSYGEKYLDVTEFRQ